MMALWKRCAFLLIVCGSVVALAALAVGPRGLGSTVEAGQAPGDRDGDTIPDDVECPDFGFGSLFNGGFEVPAVPSNTFQLLDQRSVLGWTTTASDGQIEVWGDGFLEVPAPEGRQFAELNGTEAAALFQDLPTNGGDTIAWSLSHRGRQGEDTMAVSFGPVGAPTVVATLTDDQTGWTTHSGRYTVPAGQTQTRFSLEAVSAAGGVTVGNFLDDVLVDVVDRDTDLDGTADCDDEDSDNDGLSDRDEAGPDPQRPQDSDGDGTPDYRQPDRVPTVDLGDDELAAGDAEVVSLDLSANDAGPGGAALEYAAVPVVLPDLGIGEISPDGMLTLYVDNGATGTDRLVYEACVVGDPQTCGTAEVSMVITLINDPPVAEDDAFGDPVANGQVIEWDVLRNDLDPDGALDPASLRAVTPPLFGQVEFDEGMMLYATPTEAPRIAERFDYEVCDNGEPQLCATATVTIELVEDLPPERTGELLDP